MGKMQLGHSKKKINSLLSHTQEPKLLKYTLKKKTTTEKIVWFCECNGWYCTIQKVGIQQNTDRDHSVGNFW